MLCEFAIFGAAGFALRLFGAGRCAAGVRFRTGGGYATAGGTGDICCAITVICIGRVLCEFAIFGAAEVALCLFGTGCTAAGVVNHSYRAAGITVRIAGGVIGVRTINNILIDSGDRVILQHIE